jgi:hypothetical protein
MEENLISSKAKFLLRFEGENEIDATLLSNSIRDVAELTKLAAKEEDPEAFLKMNVTAFKNGSFEIDFSAICFASLTLLSNYNTIVSFARNTIAVVKGFFEIKKFLNGEKPKEINHTEDGKIEVKNNSGQVLSVSRSSGAIITNVNIDRLVMNISYNARENNPNGGFVITTDEGDFECYSDDIKKLTTPIPIEEEKLLKQFKLNAKLPIKKPDLTGRSAWEFRYNGHLILARIDDEEWLEAVNNGNVSIRAGDYITATLIINVEVDSNGTPIPDTEKYNIIKVHGNVHHEDSEQLQL